MKLFLLLWYPLAISCNKFGESSNSVDDSYAGVSVPNKVKNIT